MSENFNLSDEKTFNMVILLCIEYIYHRSLNKPKLGLVYDAVKNGNINDTTFMANTIYQFEQDYLPPMGNLKLEEKIIADAIVESYKEKSVAKLFIVLKPGFDHFAANGLMPT
jgi:hypothetical protein